MADETLSTQTADGGSSALNAYWPDDAIDDELDLTTSDIDLAQEVGRLTSIPSELTRHVDIAAFVDYLDQRGYGSTWSWDQAAIDTYDRYPHRESQIVAGVIECASGPLKSIAFRSTTRRSDRVHPDSWRSADEVCLVLRAEWESNSTPGLHRLVIKSPVDDSGWVGNDMGLGIVERLNADPSLGTLWDAVTIAALRVDHHAGMTADLDPHAVSDHRLTVSYSRLHNYEKKQASPVRWTAPPMASWNALERVIAHLVAEPQELPRHDDASRQLRTVPAPLPYYLNWGAAFAFVFAGIAAIVATLVAWDWPRTGYVIGGLIMPAVIFWVGTLVKEDLGNVRRGCFELAGVVERKWHANHRGHQPFIRVDGLPFQVSRRIHDSLFEGDAVAITYWPGRPFLRALMGEKPSTKGIVRLRRS
jgi:hypothetical protein